MDLTSNEKIADSLGGGTQSRYTVRLRDSLFFKDHVMIYPKLRIVARGNIFGCDDSERSFALISSNAKGGGYTRLIGIPYNHEVLLEKPNENVKGLISHFHVIGHQSLQHRLQDSLLVKKEELDADYFSGFALRFYINNRQKAVESFKELLRMEADTSGFPDRAERIAKFNEGWNWADNIARYQWDQQISIEEVNQLKALAFSEDARDAVTKEAFNDAANFYLQAYSNAYTTGFGNLKKALEYATKSEDSELALRIYSELLTDGSQRLDVGTKQRYLAEMAILSRKIGAIDRAKEYQELSRTISPISTDYFESRGERLLSKKNFKEAEQAFLTAIKIGPATASMYLGLAKAQNGGGNTAAAIRSFRSVLNIEPENSEAVIGLSNVYVREAEILRVLREQETQSKERERLEKLKTELYRKAEDVLLAGLLQNADNQDILVQLYRIYLSIPDKRKARELRKELKHLN